VSVSTMPTRTISLSLLCLRLKGTSEPLKAV
jgi:hypothetical protein